MKYLTQTYHYFHLHRLISIKSLHCVSADLCRPGKISFLHLVLPYKIPEFIVTDCHEQPSVDSQISLALLYQPDHCVEFLQVLKVTIQHFGLYHEIRRFSILKIGRFPMLTVINIKTIRFLHFTTWRAVFRSGSISVFTEIVLPELHVGAAPSPVKIITS
jgi:hypothetical protein